MARYTPEFVAGARHDYEHTDKSLARIAIDRGISERTINRWRDRHGWARRSERLRDLPPAMRALQDATALLAARPPAAAANDEAADSNHVDPSSARPREGEEHVAPTASAPSAIARIERLVEKELAAEEAVRAQLGPLPRAPADAERAARTLATLTQTLQALARLRCGLPPDGRSGRR